MQKADIKKGENDMNEWTNQKLRNEISQLIRERLNPSEKDAEMIISIMKEIIQILNQEYPTKDVQGFVFRWNQKTEKLLLKTYPDEVFPNSFAQKEGEKGKLADLMSETTCKTEEITAIHGFFTDNKNTYVEPVARGYEEEVFKIVFM